MRSVYFSTLPALLLAGFLAAGCATSTNLGDTSPDITLHASSKSVFVGDTVTLSANSQNLLGKDARVEWQCPGGKVQTAEEGRMARVVFSQPGSFSVAAVLMVDGREVKRESELIEVKKLP